jgi:hypothetical protein
MRDRDRIVVEFAPETTARVRGLAKHSLTTVNAIVRRCVELSLPQVERELQRHFEPTPEELRLNLASVPKPTEPADSWQGLHLNKVAPKPEDPKDPK